MRFLLSFPLIVARRVKSTLSKPGRLDLENTKEAFRSKSLSDLLRQFFVYKALTFDLLVNHSDKVMRWSQRLLGKRIFERIMKRTFYGQFVAGEDLNAIRPMAAELKENGVSCILDYAVEEDVSDSTPVVLELRKQEHFNTLPDDSDNRHPHFAPSLSSARDIKRASARTFLYAHDNQCNENMKHFLSCIKTAAQVGSVNNQPYAAIKLTGLGKVEFLLRLSEAIEGNMEMFRMCAGTDDIVKAIVTPESLHRALNMIGILVREEESGRMFRELDLKNTGQLSVFEWANQFQPGIELHNVLKSKMSPHVTTLEVEDKLQMLAVVQRAEELAVCATEEGVRLMIDAEQTYFQPAIHHIVVNLLMPKYNLSSPVVYNTIQCYLKNAEKQAQFDIALSHLAGFMYGVKLVRGAYMEQERSKATKEGYDSPIWDNKQKTDICYHRVLDSLLEEVANPVSNVHIMVATHNPTTIKFATDRMEHYDIPPSSNAVVFGQLLGMCDYITFSLGHAGYGAYKYMPYGPVNDVLQYLQRRAHENRGVLSGPDYERSLVKKELLRRIMF